MRHPILRLDVMSYGSPLVDEMIGLMATHSTVCIDSVERPPFLTADQ